MLDGEGGRAADGRSTLPRVSVGLSWKDGGRSSGPWLVSGSAMATCRVKTSRHPTAHSNPWRAPFKALRVAAGCHDGQRNPGQARGGLWTGGDAGPTLVWLTWV